MRRLLTPPVLASEAETQQARTLHTIGWSTMVIVTCFLAVMTLLQPVLWRRGVGLILAIDAIALAILFVSSRGYPRAASWLLVGSLITTITLFSLNAGGILAPGITAFLVFVPMAGILLGERAAIGVAVACGVIAFGLVFAGAHGMLPEQVVQHSLLTRWLLLGLLAGVMVVLLRLTNGTVRAVLARAESELAVRRAAEQRLELALDAGAIGVWEQEVGGHEVIGDERAFAVFGLPFTNSGRDEAIKWRRMILTEDLPAIDAALADLRLGKPRVRVDFRVRRPTGEVRHIEAAITIAPADGQRAARHAGVMVDVSDRRAAEAERDRLVLHLGERVKELRLLHTAAKLLQADRPYERRVLGDLVAMMPAAWLHPEACVARITHGDYEVSSPDWRITPWTLRETFTTTRGHGSIEVAYLREFPGADGPFLPEERTLLSSLAEMLEAYITRDEATRERGHLEHQLRQSQKMEALGTLVGGIAHDFNNLLTAIGANVHHALLDTPADGAARRSIEEIEKAYGRAKALVKRILLFSQRVESERGPVQLAPVVEEALRLLRASLPSMIRIRTAFDADLPMALADSSQVHQIVMNLGTNAAHAMAASGGDLTVELRSMQVAEGDAVPGGPGVGSYVRLSVRDTGTGMSHEILERLFEPFFTTKGTGGTGLGLSVVHGIVRDHEGHITVDSDVGKGTTVHVCFPVVSTAATGVELAPLAVIPGDGARIMYVDDEEALVFVMTRTLQRLGYACTGFTDAGAAIHAFRTDPASFDAVVTDFAMPDMTGVELAAALLEIRPDVPVALATGYGLSDDAARAAVGIAARLHKPISVELLSHALARMLHRAA